MGDLLSIIVVAAGIASLMGSAVLGRRAERNLREASSKIAEAQRILADRRKG